MIDRKLKLFNYPGTFLLESGEEIQGLELAYTTYGEYSTTKRIIWVFHALTANADPADWWKGLVGPDFLFDPDEYFIVCVNMPGSCYGSTNPLSINPGTSKPYYHNFPFFTTRDMVRAYDLLRKRLGIEKIYIGIGGSMGGMQALEWAVEQPTLFENLIVIATNAKHSPWGIAFNTAQRMAIEADVTWGKKFDASGMEGLRAARAIAMLSYRNYQPFLETQVDEDNEKLENFKAESYQYYQASKLALRFNAYSYYTLSKAMDAHNVGRGRGSVKQALSRIKSKTIVIGIESDLLFPIEEQISLAYQIPDAKFKLIDSGYGHDGFLIETEILTDIITDFLTINNTVKLSYAK